MFGLWSLALKSLAYRRARSLLAVIAVALGAAVVSAAFTTNVAIEQSQRASALAMVGNADFVIEAVDERGFPGATVGEIQGRDLADLVVPQVQKRTFFRFGEHRGFVELLGVDPALDPQIHPYTLTAGRFFHLPDERSALLVDQWAKKVGLGIGSALDLVTRDGFQQFEVVGLLQEPDLSQRNFGGLVRVPLGVAQSTFGLEDRIQLISLKLGPSHTAEQTREGLEDAIPGVFVVRETPQMLADLEDSIRQFQVVLLFFGAIALLAGGFLVFNTLSLTVAEQVREIGLIRAAGATGREVMAMTLAQGLALGAVGGVGGVALGQVLATALVWLIGAAQNTPISGVPFSWLGTGLTLLLGCGVTVAASVMPAFQAARMPLLAALSGAKLGQPAAASHWRELAALGATVAIVGFIVLAPDEGRRYEPLALLAFFPLFVYVAGKAIPILTAVVILPVRWRSHTVGLMVERNVRRDRGRTSVTVAGFVISFSLIVALANGAASFSVAGQQWAQSLFPGQFLVVSPVAQPPELLAEFQGIPGVEQATPISMFPVVWSGLYLTAAGIDPAEYFEAFEFREGERTQAFREMRRGPAVLVPAGLAADKSIELGQPMVLRAGDREVEFTVAGIIAHSIPSSDDYGALVLPRREVEAQFGVDTFRLVAVSVAPEADLAEVGRQLAHTAELFGIESSALGDLRDAVGRGVSGLIGLLGGTVVVGVVVGALSIAATMTMNIVQRAREIAVLRAGGMTGQQVQRLAVVEAAIMGVLGAVLGIVLGVLVTWVVVDVNRSVGFEPRFYFSVQAAVAVVVLGVASAALAAFFPAGAAARTNIVEILRHE